MTSVYRVITVGAQTAYSCVLPGTSYGSTRTNWPWGRATLGGGGGGDVIVPKVDGKDSLGTCDENKIGHLTSFEGTETPGLPSVSLSAIKKCHLSTSAAAVSTTAAGIPASPRS